LLLPASEDDDECDVLRRYEGMRHEQIATHLGMSVSGVRFHMEKTKAHLAKRLEQT
jgi:DNA-directed RNA polymerase specialized sigma24 family protein